MVVYFQYGNGIYLRSALVDLAERMESDRAAGKYEDRDLWYTFYGVGDTSEARFRTRSAERALLQSLEITMRRIPLRMESPGLVPSPWHRSQGVTLSTSPERPLHWYAADGVTPRVFSHLRLELLGERSGEAMVFLYGCDADGPPPERQAAWYQVVADPWADYSAEVGELIAVLLSGDLEVGPTEPKDFHLPLLDDAITAALTGRDA